MKIFKLPDLGEGLPDAIIREWYVNVGDDIEQDQPMVAMETAKALVDVPAPFSGKVEKHFGEVGDTIDTGNPLIGFEGEAAEEIKKDAGTVVGNLEQSDSTIFASKPSRSTQPQSTQHTVKAMPAVRVLAKQLGVDLTTLEPKGNHITAEEVKRAAKLTTSAAVSQPKLSGPLTKLDGVRRAMALSMAQSHATIVPATIMGEADLSAWEAKQDVTLRLIRAMQAACNAVPLLNASYDGTQMAYQPNKKINLGLAVDTEHGLYVPVIKDIEQHSNTSLREKINHFKQQASSRSLPQEDLHGATIIMSNIGAIAGSYASPVIIPPMVAIVAFGRMREQTKVNLGNVTAYNVLPVSITFDHRPVTGGDAARFLRALIESLEAQTL